VADGRGLGAVGHQHQRRSGLVAQVTQQFEDPLPVAGIEVARGFIGQEQSGSVDERPRDGDALHLAPGEFTRRRVGPMSHAHPVQQRRHAGTAFRGRDAQQLKRQFDVLGRGQCGQQVEELEDRAEVGSLFVV